MEYEGTIPGSSVDITLHPGWNMVGYPSVTPRSRPDALNDSAAFVDKVEWWDAGSQEFREMSSTDRFEPGRGYWVHCTSATDIVWHVPV